jgi:hypothetical protein
VDYKIVGFTRIWIIAKVHQGDCSCKGFLLVKIRKPGICLP